jgi:hypothetical protein
MLIRQEFRRYHEGLRQGFSGYFGNSHRWDGIFLIFHSSF